MTPAPFLRHVRYIRKSQESFNSFLYIKHPQGDGCFATASLLMVPECELDDVKLWGRVDNNAHRPDESFEVVQFVEELLAVLQEWNLIMFSL